MLTKLVGGALVLAACGAAGLRRSRELKERVRVLETLRPAVERLRAEICWLQTPLPEALERLAREKGGLFAGLAGCGERLRNESFDALWREALSALALPAEETSVLTELGRRLASGDDPERAFAFALERLEQLRQTAREEARGKCRLSAALGLCAGALLVILLA